MTIAASLLPEFDQEMANTRRMLERVPDGKADWRPHEKSMPLGRLATHLGELPQWASNAVTLDELDIAPPDGGPFVPTILEKTAEILELFDKNIAEARGHIAGADDATMMKGWTLKVGGQDAFTMPKIAVIRTWVMNHMLHHRGQLSVYLRLLGQPLPAIYGPSADESPM